MYKKTILVVITFLLLSCTNSKKIDHQESTLNDIAKEWNFNEARQFDFWIGEWDVNLRIHQLDFSWEDKITAHTKIYRVLDGKAILELWDSEPIKGYSLRYYDTHKKKWILWLNWPGGNRSGVSNLEGTFRHKRGIFSGSYLNNKNETILFNYTFSDITPTSLRWDDAFSSDGGKTWSNNWIMEFNRTKDLPEPNTLSRPAHTFENDSLCTSEPFKMLNSFDGDWKGTVSIIKKEESREMPATIKGYKITNGCALLLFLEYDNSKEIHLQTFNTTIKKWEESILNNKLGSGMEVYYGDYNEERIETVFKDSLHTKKHIWDFDKKNNEISYELYHLKPFNDSTWVLTQKGIFKSSDL